MRATESSMELTATEQYEETIREYLREYGEAASKSYLPAGTDVPAWFIDQLASSDTFYTPLTHNHRYVASKYMIGRGADHPGFWRPEADDGDTIFDRQETTPTKLKYLAFNRPT